MIHCPYCDRRAELVGGSALYPQRLDLAVLKFWRCVPCGAYVGCHKAGAYVRNADGSRTVSDGTLPLGRLANAELRKARGRAHSMFDPLWRSRSMTRRRAYQWLADELGVSVENCHIGMMDVDGCRAVVAVVERLKLEAAC